MRTFGVKMYEVLGAALQDGARAYYRITIYEGHTRVDEIEAPTRALALAALTAKGYKVMWEEPAMRGFK